MMSWLKHVFGVHEVLFLAGFACFFYGISGLWSIFCAFAVSGVILMGIALFSIVFAQKKGD